MVCVPGVKRKLSDISSANHNNSSASPASSEAENGVFSDWESTISEQESWEMLSCLSGCEISNLGADLAFLI